LARSRERLLSECRRPPKMGSPCMVTRRHIAMAFRVAMQKRRGVCPVQASDVGESER
jgi:hypothetical protein